MQAIRPATRSQLYVLAQGDAAAVTTVAFREQSASPSALLHNPMLPGGAEPGAQYQM